MYLIIGGDGHEYGPVSADQIRQWVAAGRANLETKAKAVGTDEWKPLAEFPEIIQPAGIEPPSLSSADAPIPLGLASRGARFGGWFVDSFVYFLCFLPFCFGLATPAALAAIKNQDREALMAMPGLMLACGITGLALLVVFVLQVVLLSLRGQTIGKLLFRTRIVQYGSGAPAGFLRAFLLRYFVVGVIYVSLSLIPLGGFIFFLVDSCLIFRDDRRCVHDLIAGTKVVPAV